MHACYLDVDVMGEKMVHVDSGADGRDVDRAPRQWEKHPNLVAEEAR